MQSARLRRGAGFVGLGRWMRPQSGMHRAEYARACACLRGQIPRGAPLPRSDTPCWGFSRTCGATPSSHPHLAQRASSDLCRASLGFFCIS